MTPTPPVLKFILSKHGLFQKDSILVGIRYTNSPLGSSNCEGKGAWSVVSVGARAERGAKVLFL